MKKKIITILITLIILFVFTYGIYSIYASNTNIVLDNKTTTFTKEDNTIKINSNDKNLLYTFVDSDFETANSIKLIINQRDNLINGYKKYIDIYRENNEEKVELYTNQIQIIYEDTNNKLLEIINDKNLIPKDEYSWLNISDNEIKIDDLNSNKVLFVTDKQHEKYNIYYTLDSNKELNINQCEYSEKYLKYLTLSDSQKESQIEPSMCDNSVNNSKKRSSSDVILGSSNYPSRFSLVELNAVSSVKDQLNTGYCVAFATTNTLETYAKRKYNLDYNFSEIHQMYKLYRKYLNNQTNEVGVTDSLRGSNYYRASKYYTSNYGPILEEDMPFDSDITASYLGNVNTSMRDISELNDKAPILDVNDTVLYDSDNLCTSNEINKIKSLVYNYSAVSISMNTSFKNLNSDYFNSNTNSLYYPSTFDGDIDHAVSIVGWDDNYSKDNFGTYKPSSNGAFIVKNSWGTEWGNNGYFYLSYEDSFLCDSFFAIVDADLDVPDNMYNYNKVASNVQIGYYSNVAYGAARFRRNSSTESLNKVGVDIQTTGTIDVYLNSSLSLNNATLIGSKTFDNPGYHSITLSNNIPINNNDFYIIVKYTTASNLPIGAENNTQYINLTSNQTFISSDGKTFVDASTGGYVVSIYAFTQQTNTLDITQSKMLRFKELKKYTGSSIEQDVRLILRNRELKKGTDYTVNYTNNIGNGTATMTITGMGKYQGTIQKTFKIRNDIVGIPKCENKIYNGQSQVLFEAHNSTYTNSAIIKKDVGKYETVLSLNENNIWEDGTEGNKTIKCNLNPKKIGFLPISYSRSVEYTGSEIRPQVKVRSFDYETNDNSFLQEGVDYTVEYSNNINVGTGYIKVIGIENFYDEHIIEFKIIKTDTSKLKIKDDKYVILNRNATTKNVKNLVETGNLSSVRDGKILKEDEILATGDVISIAGKAYTVIILGDINKDGKITGSDVSWIYSYYKYALSSYFNYQVVAADVNEDGKVTGSDISYAYSLYKQN